VSVVPRVLATLVAWAAFVAVVGVFSGATPADAALTKYTGQGINDPRAIASGPDGALWFVNDNGGSIGRITTGGVVSIFDDPTLGIATDITAGPDGNLWVVSTDGNSISRVTPTGTITTFAGVGARPNSITSGPDGALWFTAEGGGLNGWVGRLTTTGGISRWFFDEGVVGRPRSITAGPDGALWFITDSASGQIGRITTAGALTTFSIPNSFVNLNGLNVLAAGPDGAMWFTGSNSNSIGRVTTSGTVQLFMVPELNRPGDIVAGPDGAVWFTQATTLGRITTTGTVTHYAAPGDSPGWLAAGSDGALWFTSWPSNSIGRLTPDNAICAPRGDLVGFWKGEDTLDSEAGNPLTGTVGYADAVVGRGFQFDGTNDVSVGSWLSGLTGELTVEAWIKPVYNGSHQTVMSQWDFPSTDDSARTFHLSLGQNRDIIWMTDEESTRRPEELAVPAPVLWDGAFHHVAATWSRTEFAIYVDGAQVASRPSQGGTLNPAYGTPIRLGSTGGLRATFGFLGVMDEPTIHSRALTPSEIGTIHAVGSIGKCP
jgi:streptogramin lyase